MKHLDKAAVVSARTVYLRSSGRNGWSAMATTSPRRGTGGWSQLSLLIAGVAYRPDADGRQSQVVPYVVKVDRLGRRSRSSAPIAAAQPDEADHGAAGALDRRGAHGLCRCRRPARLITEAYAMINRLGDAYGALNDHMRAHDPFERAKTETVAVEVQSVLPIAGDSWRIEWREDTRGRDGGLLSSTQYQATVTISFNPPTRRRRPSGQSDSGSTSALSAGRGGCNE